MILRKVEVYWRPPIFIHMHGRPKSPHPLVLKNHFLH